MNKIFEIITEIFGFIAIVLSPTLLGLGIGFISYNYIGNTLGIVIWIIIGLLGFVFGIFFAFQKWKNGGTVHFLSRISATPELEYPDDILVKARIKLLSEQEGGITIPFRTKVRPNHYFGVKEEFGKNMITNIGEITFDDEFFYENETKDVYVRFLWAQNIKDITVGTKWIICFGNRKIGEGEIIEI
ncbi:MAG: hypothetical protein IPJ43_20995 [Saprospiraceae bacterium]|nr:hypothetical protein [Saprospiraceae bacterium]